MRYHYKLF